MRLIAISLVSIAMLSVLLAWNSCSKQKTGGQPIVVYAAVALQPPIEELARAYTAETGSPIQVEYGASQVLLAQLEIRKNGDVYIPADGEYLKMVDDKGLVQSTVPLTRLRPVVAVAAGNPRGVKTLDDLLRKDVRLGFPDPKMAAIGRIVRNRLVKEWGPLWSKGIMLRATVSEAAADIKFGIIDATFTWDSTVKQMPELAAVEVPEFADIESKVAAGILKTSKQPENAQAFVRYLTASDRGQPVFERSGYQTFGGEPWSRPESR
jgi:molybdate transport system substrate-binding protein